ncbi:MAG: hypothetical protein LKK18_03225 [Clostridiales bacterium]|jgi:hypothetical protein|nr:hypothetical protein [Clostridiales bacterium]
MDNSIVFTSSVEIGSSIIAPTTLALMMDAYTGEMRTRAIAYYGATPASDPASVFWWEAV